MKLIIGLKSANLWYDNLNFINLPSLTKLSIDKCCFYIDNINIFNQRG